MCIYFPLQIVMWLPTLCRKKDVPYVIAKDKSRLGRLINKKNCAVVALTEPRKEDAKALSEIVTVAREKFNDNEAARKRWGGGRLGPKAYHKIQKAKKLIAKVYILFRFILFANTYRLCRRRRCVPRLLRNKNKKLAPKMILRLPSSFTKPIALFVLLQ